jgi:hypothetical protein
MAEMWRTEWVGKRAKVAIQLASGDCGGTYGDAALILCSCLSAVAADVWPGDRVDRNRFVELLERYAPSQLAATRVSVPLLVEDLRRQQKDAEASQLESKFLQQFSTETILIGNEVDKDENEIQAACGSVSSKCLRMFSYADLLYREVRSSYTHEGKTGHVAESWSMTALATHVSYVNWSIPPRRRIHFPIEWIAELARGAAEAVDQMMPVIPSTPFQPPAKWWLEG